LLVSKSRPEVCTRAFFKGQILRKLLPAKALSKACFSWYWRPKKRSFLQRIKYRREIRDESPSKSPWKSSTEVFENFKYLTSFYSVLQKKSPWIPRTVYFWHFWPWVQLAFLAFLLPKTQIHKSRHPRLHLFQFALTTQIASNWAKEINLRAFSTFVTHGRMMIKSIPKIGVKLAGKMTIVTQVKNVSDITINAWLIEASALMRWKVAKKQKIAANLTNVAAELAVKPSTTQNLPNYHAFLT